MYSLLLILFTIFLLAFTSNTKIFQLQSALFINVVRIIPIWQNSYEIIGRFDNIGVRNRVPRSLPNHRQFGQRIFEQERKCSYDKSYHKNDYANPHYLENGASTFLALKFMFRDMNQDFSSVFRWPHTSVKKIDKLNNYSWWNFS